MSSSAALECSLAFGLNELFSAGLDDWQLIKICQLAEHKYVGTKCGIMDQFASIMGKKDQAIKLDCRSLEFQYIPLDLKDYEILLLNSSVSHSLADSEYNKRRAECEEGLSILAKQDASIQSFRDLNEHLLSNFNSKLPKHILNRCRHVVTENQRVIDAVASLHSGNINRLGELLYQSHHSLSKSYEVSCKELDFLVEKTIDNHHILGSRMMGGGFGGCTLNIIHKSASKAFIEEAYQSYKDKFGLELLPYKVAIADGAKIISSQ